MAATRGGHKLRCRFVGEEKREKTGMRGAKKW